MRAVDAVGFDRQEEDEDRCDEVNGAQGLQSLSRTGTAIHSESARALAWGTTRFWTFRTLVLHEMNDMADPLIIG